jgi:surface antigen
MAVVSWRNFKASSFRTGNIPMPGALVFWQHGNSSQGHAGVVIAVLDNGYFISVEGNTNTEGGREGIEVGQMKRKTVAPFSAKGLNLLGFVYAPE